MRKLYNLYKAQQNAQYQWMRNHPKQYVALNATLLAVIFGYTYYKDVRYGRELDELSTITNEQ